MKHLYIIITDFNGYEQTQKCLRALRKSLYRDFTVVVVDHGTTDETNIGLASDFPDVARIRGSTEHWWAGATNLGIRFALDHGADAVLLLNNDCYVTPEAIGILVHLAASHPDAIIAPVQRDWLTQRTTTVGLSTLFLLGFPTLSEPLYPRGKMMAKELLPVRLIRGGRGVIIPATVFRQLGLFDEHNLPHYYADHDFYLRARKNRVQLFIATRAFVHIDDTRTTLAAKPGTMTRYEFWNSLHDIRSHRNLQIMSTLFRKHYPIPKLHFVGTALYVTRYFLIYAIRRSTFLIRGKRPQRS